MKRFWRPVYTTYPTNSLSAFVPEVWAQESLMVLEANMVAANLVHRDFENEIATFGETVNTRKPAEFEVKRKTDDDEVTIQNSTATNIPVVLNQWLHTSFMIMDGEQSKGFKNLRDEYLVPAMMSLAQGLDEIVLGQAYEFMANSAGQLGAGMSKAAVIDAREVLNTNKCPATGRNLIVTPNGEGDLLAIDNFVTANTVGDAGTALREGSLGRKYGFDIFMCQNAPSVAVGCTVVTGAINYSPGYDAGTTSLTVDGLSAAIVAGTWCTIDGDDIPQMIAGSTGGATPTAIVITPGLKRAVVNDAVVTIYDPGAINLSAGYAASWSKPIAVDSLSVAPRVGNLISTGATSARKVYSALKTPTTVELLFNRALDAAVANNDVVGVGPAGEFNFAFNKNAIALVMRPLQAPEPGTGAKSYVAQYNGLGIRVTITYNGTRQGHLVTCDLLAGVKTLDTAYGCIVYG